MHLYTLCTKCDHFVDENEAALEYEGNQATHIHLEDGMQEFDHDAEPSTARHTLDKWKELRPDLFHEYPDGAIGPNSTYHDRRGKDDGGHLRAGTRVELIRDLTDEETSMGDFPAGTQGVLVHDVDGGETNARLLHPDGYGDEFTQWLFYLAADDYKEITA
jgi:hypothetical protein